VQLSQELAPACRVVQKRRLPATFSFSEDYVLAPDESAAVAIRKVLSEMSSERDRILLVRFYLHDEDKEVICRDLGVSGPNFNLVLFRARARFLELLQDRGLLSKDLLCFSIL